MPYIQSALISGDASILHNFVVCIMILLTLLEPYTHGTHLVAVDDGVEPMSNHDDCPTRERCSHDALQKRACALVSRQEAGATCCNTEEYRVPTRFALWLWTVTFGCISQGQWGSGLHENSGISYPQADFSDTGRSARFYMAVTVDMLLQYAMLAVRTAFFLRLQSFLTPMAFVKA